MKQLLLSCLFVLLSSFLFGQKNYQEAIKMAKEKYDAEEYGPAILLYDKAISFDASKAEAFFGRALSYENTRDYDKSLADFNKAIQLNPTDWFYYRKRGDIYYNMDKFQESLDDYTKAMSLEKTKRDSTLYFYRGDAFLRLERFDEAVKDYSKAIEISPKYTKYRMARASAYKKLNKNDEACKDYEEAKKLGDEFALGEARLISCEWSKIKVNPADRTKVHTISKVQVDPFTGAVFISKGITFKEYEIKPETGYLIASDIALGNEIDLKLKNPEGFVQDEAGEIHFGIGFAVYDSKGTELGKVNDLYEGQADAMPLEYLSALTLTLSFSAPLKEGEQYLLKARFFDKFGTGEAFVDMPFRIVKKSPILNFVEYTTNKYFSGSNTSASEGVEINKVTFKSAGASIESDAFNIPAGKKTIVSLKEIKGLGANVSYKVSLYSRDGKLLKTYNSKGIIKSAALDIPLTEEILDKGNFLFRVQVTDDQNPLKVWNLTGEVYVK